MPCLTEHPKPTKEQHLQFPVSIHLHLFHHLLSTFFELSSCSSPQQPNPTKTKMQLSTFFVTLLPVLALAAPSVAIPKRQVQEDINTAMLNWLQDTGFVSSYLDAAASLAPSDVLSDGALALAAENDELNHKAILDNFFIFETDTPDQNVINANTVLVTEGHFQMVVDQLQDISVTGNLADIQAINWNRCTNVLPAIDAYFFAVSQVTGGVFYPAIRPLACGGV